ncbi:hypothetical protein MHF_1065 [Mycoplasma haemofelis Ohio2]|uniref:Uncharacterized protein n=1 Tax=Mycoplasma haemofelis (strain Ohio2) TaxID=859194 RepID=F6FJG0_MYCHI|nr:hypothetical protein MHF_1065 [Mycoplasma haemofelis Ohio2]
MSPLSKVGLGFAGLTGVSGAGYLGFQQLAKDPKESFKSKYALAVKDFLSNDATLTKKLNSLGGDSSSPKHPDLVNAKKLKGESKVTDATASLKKGCEDIHNKPIDSGFFEDFKNYCSFNNEDKIEGNKTFVAASGDVASKQQAFSNKNLDQLQKGFTGIAKPAGSPADTNWQNSMLTECKKLATEIFEGEIPNFKEFCVKG